MPAIVHCPTCRHPLTVDEAHAGQVVTCPTCRHPLTVPALVSSPPSAPEDPGFTPRRRRRPSRWSGQLIIAFGFVGLVLAGAIVAVIALASSARKEPEALKEKPPVEPVHKAPAAETRAPAMPRPVTPKRDEKAERLRQADKEAMAAFREGKPKDGFAKLLEAATPYKDRDPGDCSPEEALAIAVIYVRIATIGGKSLPEKTLLAYTTASEVYSIRGGIRLADYRQWFDRLVRETADAGKP